MSFIFNELDCKDSTLCQVDISKIKIVAIYNSTEEVKEGVNDVRNVSKPYKYVIKECLKGTRKNCAGFAWILYKDLKKTTLKEFCFLKKSDKSKGLLDTSVDGNFTNDVLCQIDREKYLIVAEYVSFEDLLLRCRAMDNILDAKIGIIDSLKGKHKLCGGFLWCFKRVLLQKGIEKYCNERMVEINEDRLLSLRFPNIAIQIDIEASNMKLADINKLYAYSRVELYWKCMDNSLHQSFPYPINYMTNTNLKNKCPNCRKDKLIDKLKEREKWLKSYQPDNSVYEMGLETERYIFQLLVSLDIFPEVELMGSSNCDTDIKVSLNNGDKKCLQIKTLSNRNCPNTEVYRACNLLYRRNILIVMANEKRNKFCLGFSEQFKCSDVWFDFDKMNYPNLMYDNIDIFTKKLVQLVQESVNFDIIIASATVKIELECMERLKLWCEKNSLSFKRCDNHASSIDCYINNISVQVKCRKGDSRSNIHTKNFNVRINKGAGKKINRIRQPYEPGDFEMLIVEINEPIYHNKFFFISQYDLFEYGFLRSELTYGKENMLVSNPNYKIGNWSDIFWDETITINRIKKFEEYKQGKVMEYLEDGYLYPGVDPLEYLSEDSKIDDIQRVNIKNIIKMNTDRNKTQSDILTNIHFVESKTEKIFKKLR